MSKTKKELIHEIEKLRGEVRVNNHYDMGFSAGLDFAQKRVKDYFDEDSEGLTVTVGVDKQGLDKAEVRLKNLKALIDLADGEIQSLKEADLIETETG